MIRRLSAVVAAIVGAVIAERTLHGLLAEWAASARAYEALRPSQRPTDPPPSNEWEAYRQYQRATRWVR